MADKNSNNTGLGYYASGTEKITKVKEVFNETSAITDTRSGKTPEISVYMGTVMGALCIGIVLLIGLNVIMSKVKTENREEGDSGVIRSIGLVTIAAMLVLIYIAATTRR